MARDLKGGPMDSKGKGDFRAIRSIGPHKTESKDDRRPSFPISRRGFLAGLATLAGLGLFGPRDAFGYAAVDFSPGAGYIGPNRYDGILTHPDRTQGNNDRWFGYANSWDLWNINSNYNNRLGYAFAMVFECDWSDELYDHLVFRPFYYCTSYCSSNNWKGWWLGASDGDDNKGTCYMDGVAQGTFVGNLINDGSSGEDRHVNAQGWLYHGFYGGPGWSTFVRRQAAQTAHNVYAHIDIFNCWKNNVPPSSAIVSSQNAPANKDMYVQTEKIYIDNDMSIVGGIFKIIPVSAPNLRLDLIQGSYENGKPVTRYENGRGTCLYHDYDGVNQNWIFRPNKSDGLGTFTFCVANMVGPGLDRGLDNSGHTSPTMDRGYATIYRNSESTNLTNSWWVHHEPKSTNETDHSCWYFTSDADGQRLDTWGVTTDSIDTVKIASDACPGLWATQRNAQWMLEEAICHGEIGLSENESKTGEVLKIIGWHNHFDHEGDNGEEASIRPAGWLRVVKNESDLPVYPMFRLYMTDSEVEIEDDPDAVIMASCGVVTWAAEQSEGQANMHLGWPHGGHSMYNLYLRLKGSKFDGSIHYAARPQGGGEWVEGADGVRILTSDSAPMAQVKIWLEGDIAENYDLCYRAFLGGLGWSDTVYSNSADAASAPVVGTAASEPDDESGSTGWFEFRTPSGFCLDIYDGGHKENVNGQNVELFTSNSTVAQQFCVYSRGDTTYIANYLGCLLDVYSNKNVQIWQANHGKGPKWQIEQVEGGVLVRSQWTGGLMTYASEADGANVSCEDEREDHANQVWKMVSVPARSEGATGKILGLNVHLIRKPKGGRVVQEFMTDESFEVTEDMGSGYLYAAAMLGIRTVPFTESRVWTDRYRGTVISKPCRVESVCVEYYSDGIDGKHLVYRDSNVHAGDAYAPVAEALEAAGKKPCNLNERFGDDAASGFTGWFKDADLTDAGSNLEIPEKGALKLYGRNRCTLRIEYAEGSVEPSEGLVFRKKPLDSAEVADAALGLIDFSGRAERHALDGIDLPAIGDDGAAHAAFYRGESVTLSGSADVYAKSDDGTWRRLAFKGYLPDKAGGGTPLKTIKMERDTTVYAMWAYADSDGVAATKK